MKPLLDALLATLERGERCVLCTVLSAEGSSPRGAGARMAVFADGATLGTVGGGAAELLCTQRALHALQSGENDLHTYQLHPGEADEAGMICGGAITVLSQCLCAPDEPVLRRWRAALEQDVDLWLLLMLDGAQVRSFSVCTRGELPPETSLRAGLHGGVYAERLARAGRVVIFGAGHVGRALVPVLATLGFRVLLFDDRPALARKELHPAADEVVCGDFCRIGERVTLTENDYAVIMSPGHRSDYALLSQVLKTGATYIGCIGSRKKAAKTRELLLADGFTEADLARIHSPIGLPILAETPEEIAISVAAELIEHRARRG